MGITRVVERSYRARPTQKAIDYWNEVLSTADWKALHQYIDNLKSIGVAYPGAPSYTSGQWSRDMRWLYGKCQARLSELGEGRRYENDQTRMEASRAQREKLKAQYEAAKLADEEKANNKFKKENS